MRLYALRHGETSWNVQRRFQGQSDIPLNDKGILLAELTGEGLANIPFDLAFTSPLCRARQTAELVLAGRDVPLYVEPRLIEMAFGVYEGVTGQLRAGGTLNQNLVDFICHAERYQAPEGGESFEELSKRDGGLSVRPVPPEGPGRQDHPAGLPRRRHHRYAQRH